KTISINANEDAYLPRKLAEPPHGPLYVDNVFSRQIVLKFDLSSIPRESTINQATLTLNVLGDLSIIKDNGVSQLTNGITIQLNRLAKPFESPNDLKVDSLAASVSETITQSTTSIVIPNESFRDVFRRLIQAWVSERAENHGFVIRTLTPGFDISRVAFRSSDQSEFAPKLELDFTTAPSNP
ncbi:DNRLRE domain-containing protein, partial [candidate division KSB1 bacterium]|nr:DNRLRE domain-containing protein [candidate division KSB1 bacterium]NIR70210.1 DNRLRE domain-containing protein [candidate division KSB1 bacterium]NIS26481.1 DNRLRE domain-containing protein [candidate division KSB1 bacterium]NIT73243.1 DNRLRE domain-containing protein [candidate division KSB1 bacterium]NIU23867.1 DNRLRE domain-containing protein [candidate division KSB1 bacterium]